MLLELLFLFTLDDRPARKTLEHPQQIQGYECDRGYAWFFPSGKLSACSVRADSAFGETRVPAGSRIHLNAAGQPHFVFLAHDAKLLSLTCRGSGHDYMTAYYPSGKLRVCWLASDQDVNGVPCAKATFLADVFGGGVGTSLHENGRLASCKLSRSFALEGRKFDSGDHIHLDEKGHLRAGKGM